MGSLYRNTYKQVHIFYCNYKVGIDCDLKMRTISYQGIDLADLAKPYFYPTI